jgi:hypothetical protein
MGNWHLPLHELDFSHFYFHWNLSSAWNGFLCEIVADNENDKQHKNLVKQHILESMKWSDVMSNKNGFNIRFTNDGNVCIHIWFKRFLLDYVMLYWLELILRFLFLDIGTQWGNINFVLKFFRKRWANWVEPGGMKWEEVSMIEYTADFVTNE